MQIKQMYRCVDINSGNLCSVQNDPRPIEVPDPSTVSEIKSLTTLEECTEQRFQRADEQSEAAHRAGGTAPPIQIPVGRGRDLSQELQSTSERLENTKRLLKENLAIKATKGIDTPAHILTEIKDQKKEIQRLEQRSDALATERDLQNRYESELCIFAILRGELSIAKGHTPRNAEVLALADRIHPDLFNKDSILLGLSPARLANKFKGTGKDIDKEIERLGKLAFAHPGTKLLRQRLESLNAAKQTSKATSDSWSTIFTSSDVELPLFSNDASATIDLTGDKGWHLRLSTYQISSEAKEPTSAVALREIYDPDNMQEIMQKLHIAITFYVPWHFGHFSLSKNTDLTNNLLRLKSRLCKLCKKALRGETSSYRLPSCILFLRFYDETEQLEDRLQTTLPHIPFCKVLESGSLTDDGENAIDERGRMYNCSIPDWVFGELFKRQMVGSNWLEQGDLQTVYEVLRKAVPKKVGFILHSQFYKLGGKHGGTTGISTLNGN